MSKTELERSDLVRIPQPYLKIASSQLATRGLALASACLGQPSPRWTVRFVDPNGSRETIFEEGTTFPSEKHSEHPFLLNSRDEWIWITCGYSPIPFWNIYARWIIKPNEIENSEVKLRLRFFVDLEGVVGLEPQVVESKSTIAVCEFAKEKITLPRLDAAYEEFAIIAAEYGEEAQRLEFDIVAEISAPLKLLNKPIYIGESMGEVFGPGVWDEYLVFPAQTHLPAQATVFIHARFPERLVLGLFVGVNPLAVETDFAWWLVENVQKSDAKPTLLKVSVNFSELGIVSLQAWEARSGIECDVQDNLHVINSNDLTVIEARLEKAETEWTQARKNSSNPDEDDLPF